LGICTKEPKSNSNKIKSQVENNVQKGTKKWVLKFVVTDFMGEKEIGAKNTKGEAIELAREYTEKHQQTTSIHMEKRLEGASSMVATVRYKQSSEEQEGQYLFFGWAAC
jgi:hypothetical protein